MALFVAYFLTVVIVFPRETWIDMDVLHRRLTMTAVFFLIVPGCVALALVALWEMRAKAGWKKDASVNLVGRDLTLEMEGQVVRRVQLDEANVRYGAWTAGGQVAGALLRAEGSREAFTIGTPNPRLAREGLRDTPDAVVSEADFRQLATWLGLS